MRFELFYIDVIRSVPMENIADGEDDNCIGKPKHEFLNGGHYRSPLLSELYWTGVTWKALFLEHLGIVLSIRQPPVQPLLSRLLIFLSTLIFSIYLLFDSVKSG